MDRGPKNALGGLTFRGGGGSRSPRRRVRQALTRWVCDHTGRKAGLLESLGVAGRWKRGERGGLGTALKTNSAIQHKPNSWQLLLSSLEEGILFVDPDSLTASPTAFPRAFLLI